MLVTETQIQIVYPLEKKSPLLWQHRRANIMLSSAVGNVVDIENTENLGFWTVCVLAFGSIALIVLRHILEEKSKLSTISLLLDRFWRVEQDPRTNGTQNMGRWVFTQLREQSGHQNGISSFVMAWKKQFNVITKLLWYRTYSQLITYCVLTMHHAIIILHLTL